MIFIDIHTHNFSVNDCIAVQSFDISEYHYNYNDYFTIGIHPWKISEDWKSKFELIKDCTKNTFCLGIGEAGLDRLKEVELALQEEVFLAHVQLSEELGLPLVLHVVRAYEKILELHKKINPKFPWIVHDFLSSIEIAKQFWKKNIYTSFGEKLFISPKIQNVFQEAPLELCFLETDESLIPIQKIYDIAANFKNVSKITLMEKIYENFRKLFSRANV